MKTINFLILVNLVLILNQVHAQVITNYTLTVNYITSIANDSQGNVWVGTFDDNTGTEGISKFDGTTWTNFTTTDGLFGEYICAYVSDSKGHKWFGPSTLTKSDTINSGLGGQTILSIVEDAQGNKWYLTYNGFSNFDGINWTKFIVPTAFTNIVTVFAIDADGNKWIGTRGDGAWKFDGISYTHYTEANGLPGVNIISIAIDDQGNKWFGTQDWEEGHGRGISKFDGTTWTTYTTEDGLADDYIRGIAIDDQGNKWIGTALGGVSEFDDTTWITYNQANGLPCNEITTVTIDSIGNKWFGTAGCGVSELLEGSYGIANITLNNITLYPNPVHKVLRINFVGKSGMLEVIDVTGKFIFQQAITQNNISIDVSGFDKGIYFVKLLSDKQILLGKFIKN